MPGQGMHMAPQMQCYCPACNTLLSFPSGATFVQCPQCQTTMNTQPAAPQHIAPPPPPPAPTQQQSQLNFLHCPSCQCLLSHPPSSITIQCPRCMHIIDVSHKAATITAAPDQQQPISGGSGVLGGHNSAVVQKQPQLPEVVVRKKRKDPNAPKRASNAYMIFCKERRAQLKLDRPDLPFGQLGKRLGEMWRSMSAEEKRLYEDRATGDRDRYKGEMNSYQSTAMMKGGRGSSGGGSAGKGNASHDASSEGDSHHDGDGDGEGDVDGDGEGDDEGHGSEEASGHDDEEHEVKVREKQNGDIKRVKNEVKVDTDSHAEKGESSSD